MAEKGRRGTVVATPAKLKLVEGRSPGHDSGGRPVKEPPAFKRLPPAKPRGMSRVAAKHWDQVIGELARLELVKPIDAGALEMLCEAYARWHEAREIRKSETILGKNSQGVVRHPAVAVEEAAAKEYHRWAREFGMTPSAESSLAAPEASDGDANPFAGATSG